jgi:HD-GYP domain-containing protein (c-di-GMP phosphodiesterase class II)
MNADHGSPPPPPPELGLSVLHSRSLADLPLVQAGLVEAEAGLADLFLRFVKETATVHDDEGLLFPLVTDFTFQAFPKASHFVLVTQDLATGRTEPLIARSRSGDAPEVALSSTLVEKVMREGIALLYTQPEGAEGSPESVLLSGIRTALCAPLAGREEAFGVMQLDIRHPAKGTFSRREVDRITVFAHYVALMLENHRLHQEHRLAFESTIDALVHSLSLKDPETAHHSERVRDVSLFLGRAMGLSGNQLEALGVAATLHDMGKQGIRDEVLLKPGRLSESERTEMSQHAEHTQGVLDRIAYPRHLRDVPRLAAYHHEKMNGSGPYRIPGAEIPIPSRIISVADVFDALVSARVYKDPMPPAQVVAILERGKGEEWDAEVVDTVRRVLPRLLAEVYGHADPGQAAA